VTPGRSQIEPRLKASHRLVEQHANVRRWIIVESDHDGHRHSHYGTGERSQRHVAWLAPGPFGEDLAKEFHGRDELVQQGRSQLANREDEIHALSLVRSFLSR